MQQLAQPVTAGLRGLSSRKTSTGGCRISLDRDSVSKEFAFQSRIDLGKTNTCICQFISTTLIYLSI